ILGRWSSTWETLAASRPVIDQALLGMLGVGQIVLAIWGIAPGVAAELTPLGLLSQVALGAASHIHAYGAGAWILLAALVAALVVSLWHRPTTAVWGLILLAITVPILFAGRFETDHGSSPALRWGLGACFLCCSALVWLRQPLNTIATVLRMPFDP